MIIMFIILLITIALKVQALFWVYGGIMVDVLGGVGVFWGHNGVTPNIYPALCVSQWSRPPTLSPNFAVAGTHVQMHVQMCTDIIDKELEVI